MAELFKFHWRRPKVVLVKSARRFTWPTLAFNTYPTAGPLLARLRAGCWIGLALYWRQRGLSLLWGRPGGLR